MSTSEDYLPFRLFIYKEIHSSVEYYNFTYFLVGTTETDNFMT